MAFFPHVMSTPCAISQLFCFIKVWESRKPHEQSDGLFLILTPHCNFGDVHISLELGIILQACC
jgi:hypothetical protein